MLPALLPLLLAFPPMTAEVGLEPLHYGTPGPATNEAAAYAADAGAWVFFIDTRRDRSLGEPAGAERGDLWQVFVRRSGRTRQNDLGLVGCLAKSGTTFTQPRAVATTGGQGLVAWVRRLQQGSSQELFVALHRADGTLTCPDAPVAAPGDLIDYDVAFNGQGALVAWTTASQVVTLALDAAGQPLDAGPQELATPGSGQAPSVTGVDGGFLVGWVGIAQADGLVRHVPSGATTQLLSATSTVALASRAAGPALGHHVARTLKVADLTESGSASLFTVALPQVDHVLLKPYGEDRVVAVGWDDAGVVTSAAVLPGGPTPLVERLPSGHHPLALTRINGGALLVNRRDGAAQAPLTAWVTTSPVTTALAWDGGSPITLEANQFTPSIAWGGASWFVAWDEADVPLTPGVVTHAAELALDGSLVTMPDLIIPSGAYVGVVGGGGRLAARATNPTKDTLQSMTLAAGSFTVGGKIAEAPTGLRRAALGPAEALQWSDGPSGAFNLSHSTAGNPMATLSASGVPGRCAARVGSSFYLPVWRSSKLMLYRFDSASPGQPTELSLATFSTAGGPACAAENGTQVLIAWSSSTGISAWRFDTTTGGASEVQLQGFDSGDKAPVVAAIDGGWVMVWEADTAAGGHWLLGRAITLDGVAEPQATPVGQSTVLHERRPELASSGTGQAALTWVAFDAVTGQTRTWARIIGVGVTPDGGVAPSDAGAGPDGGGELPGDGGATQPDGGGLRPDAGADDLVRFTSCGCDGAPGGLTALLGLLALARRRERA